MNTFEIVRQMDRDLQYMQKLYVRQRRRIYLRGFRRLRLWRPAKHAYNNKQGYSRDIQLVQDNEGNVGVFKELIGNIKGYERYLYDKRLWFAQSNQTYRKVTLSTQIDSEELQALARARVKLRKPLKMRIGPRCPPRVNLETPVETKKEPVNEDGSFRWDNCDKVTDTKQSLIKHKRTIHKQDPHKCLIWSKKLPNVYVGNDHIRTCHPDELAEKATGHLARINSSDEEEIVTDIKPRTIPTSVTRISRMYKQYVDEKGQVICLICESKFPDRKSCLSHLKKTHDMDEHQWQICHRRLRSRVAARYHLYHVHIDEYNLNKDNYEHLIERIDKNGIKDDIFDVKSEIDGIQESVDNTNTDRLICYVCNGTFQKQKNMDRHIKKFHSQDTYECNMCKRRIMGKAKCREHVFCNHREEYHANIQNLDSLMVLVDPNFKSNSTSPPFVLQKLEEESPVIKLEPESSREADMKLIPTNINPVANI